MPWSGSGTFTRIYGATGWTDDKNNGVKILASRHDAHDQDIADGINACLTRDNQAKPTSSFLPAVDNTLSLGSASFRWLLNGQAPALLAQSNLFRLDTNGTFDNSFTNASAGVIAQSMTTVRNGANTLFTGITGINYASSAWTGGPTGQQVFFGGTGNIPLSIGTNSTERVRIAGDGSLINLQSTDLQLNSQTIWQRSAIKAAATARNTTTTFADDPDLTIAIPASGTYEIAALIFATNSTTITQGFKYQIISTGTISSQTWYAAFGNNGSSGLTATAVSTTITQAVANANIADYYAPLAIVVVTGGAQTIKVQWAQNSSSANNTSVNAGSFLRIRRIA